MTTCYLIRHADKEQGDFYNPRLRHQDMPISQNGRLEAQKLCSFFADKPVSRIYVSAYQRTWQTIEAIAGELQLTPVIDERLNEIDNGLIDGMGEAEMQRAYPDTWKAFVGRTADFRFPEGETGEEAQRRIVDILEETRRLPDAENVILVSHDGLIRLLMCYLVKLPVYKRWNFQVDTCGITEITYQPVYGEWKLIRFNQTC